MKGFEEKRSNEFGYNLYLELEDKDVLGTTADMKKTAVSEPEPPADAE